MKGLSGVLAICTLCTTISSIVPVSCKRSGASKQVRSVGADAPLISEEEMVEFFKFSTLARDCRKSAKVLPQLAIQIRQVLSNEKPALSAPANTLIPTKLYHIDPITGAAHRVKIERGDPEVVFVGDNLNIMRRMIRISTSPQVLPAASLTGQAEFKFNIPTYPLFEYITVGSFSDVSGLTYNKVAGDMKVRKSWDTNIDEAYTVSKSYFPLENSFVAVSLGRPRRSAPIGKIDGTITIDEGTVTADTMAEVSDPAEEEVQEPGMIAKFITSGKNMIARLMGKKVEEEKKVKEEEEESVPTKEQIRILEEAGYEKKPTPPKVTPKKDAFPATQGQEDFLYWRVKVPWPMSAREYGYAKRTELIALKGTTADVNNPFINTSIIALQISVKHPRITPNKSYNTIFNFKDGCAVFPENKFNDISKPGMQFINYHLEDPKSALPQWFVDFALKKAMPASIETLHQYCVKKSKKP